MRTIRAPGTEINEIDRSQYDALTESYLNTTTLAMGFADKGDDYDPKYVFSLNDFINTYGEPTNEAERYFYFSAKEIFDNGGLMIAAKLPYDNGSLNKYTYETYNVSTRDDFVSPYEILINEYIPGAGGKTLQNLFVMDGIGANVLSNNLSTSLDVVDMFYDFLNAQCNFDNSLISAAQSLFHSPAAFYNVSCLLENQFDDIVPAPFVSDNYLKKSELSTALQGKIPDGSTLTNSNKVKESYVNFSNAFETIWNPLAQREDDEEDSGTTTGWDDIVVDNMGAISSALSSICQKFEYSGMTTYEQVIEDFSKSLTLTDIKECYMNISAVNGDNESPILSPNFITYDKLSNYFNETLTDVAKQFLNVKTFKRIESNPDSSGLISIDQLDSLKTGSSKPSNNSFVIVDMTRGQYKKDESSPNKTECLGILPVIVSPVNAMYYQNLLDEDEPFSNYNPLGSSLKNVQSNTSTNQAEVNSDSFSIPLRSDNSNDETVGSIAASYFPSMNYVDENTIDPTNLLNIGVVIFQMVSEPSNNNKISFIPVESFVGSFDRNATDNITNASIFIDTIINENSQFINFFSNVNVQEKTDTYVASNQIPVSLGFYEIDKTKDISFNVSIKNAIDVILSKLEDTNRIWIDLVVDGGVSNIAQFIAASQPNAKGKYTPDSNNINGFRMLNSNSVGFWKQILTKYDNFCSKTRKDCMFICDGPRQLVLDGNLPVIRKTNLYGSVRKNILPYIKYLALLNTSYGAGYLNWFKCYDDFRRVYTWVPPSIKALGVYLRCDQNDRTWDAPAGMTRGKIPNAYDVAFNPTNSEAGTIYDSNWNYALSYPLDGIVLEGQKTFQKNKTAFDRVNVRRLFLGLERAVWRLSRQFLYEGLTEKLISSFNDIVNDYMTKVQADGGINEFYVICDKRNNTNETIDNNTLNCTIGIKPVKSLEFIVLNFICTNQSMDVQEVTEQSI